MDLVGWTYDLVAITETQWMNSKTGVWLSMAIGRSEGTDEEGRVEALPSTSRV